MVRRARVSRALVFAALLALPAATAAAQGRLDRVSIDRVRIQGGGHVEVWVSAQDPDGQPISGLGRESFTVAWDGRAPSSISAERVEERDPGFHLTVLIDPEIVRDEGSSVRALLGALADRGGARDQLRLALTSRDGGVSGPLERGEDLAGKLESLAQGGGTTHLYDALFREVQQLSHYSKGQSGGVLLLTHGIESGSRREVPEILALARGNAQHVPVMVVLYDPRGSATEGERLSRFAPASGGSFTRIESPERMADAAGRAVRRVRAATVLAFRDPHWDGGADHHLLEVGVRAGEDQRAASENVITAEVLGRAWWQGALPWVLLLMVILLTLGALPFVLRRPLLRLRVSMGDEKGFVYEIYEVPVTIGAAAGNDLIFIDDEVSRNHAVFERRGAAVELVDSNSENGTFVNGDRVSRRRVSRGDRIQLGEAVEFEVIG